jgi:hypothetical protein
MDYPVTSPEQLSAGEPGFGQVTQNPRHHSPVSASGKPFLDCRRREPLDPQRRLRRAEPLANPPMRRSPLPASNSANLTDELPELNTSTEQPELPELPAVAWPGLTANQSWSMLALLALRYARRALVGRALVSRAIVSRARLLAGRRARG